MPALEDRLLRLLRAVIEEYIQTAEPVGSQALVQRQRLAVSPATIRNWFAELDEGGYLTHRHASSGRVPTEKGFQLYVTSLIRVQPLAAREREALRRALEKGEYEQRVKQLAKTLAELSGQAVYVGWRRADTYYTGLSQLFAQREFREWQQVVSLTEVLDHLDETLIRLRRNVEREPRSLLGRHCPFGPVCGTVTARLGAEGVWGILGPVRMNYERALSLLSASQELVST